MEAKSFPLWGGGSEAVWKFSENSSNLVQVMLPKGGLKEDEKVESQNFTANAQFLRQTSETFLGMSLGPRGMLWAIMAHFGPPRKSALFQKRGRKRMKELGEVTFIKEEMKALLDAVDLAPTDLV